MKVTLVFLVAVAIGFLAVSQPVVKAMIQNVNPSNPIVTRALVGPLEVLPETSVKPEITTRRSNGPSLEENGSGSHVKKQGGKKGHGKGKGKGKGIKGKSATKKVKGKRKGKK